MDAYVYRAALLCPDCADSTMHRLRRQGQEEAGDSDCWPQGPFPAGAGEADSPQHCDQCKVFLQNPLTDTGRAYVSWQLLEYQLYGHGEKEVIKAWREFYGPAIREEPPEDPR